MARQVTVLEMVTAGATETETETGTGWARTGQATRPPGQDQARVPVPVRGLARSPGP